MNCVQNMPTMNNVQYISQSQCAMSYQWGMQQQYQMNAYAVQQEMAPVSTQKKLVIFDWDDTIFPTTALLRNKEKVSGAELDVFGKAAYELLVDYIERFSAENIYIVTNGLSHWVQQSLDIMIKRRSALSLSGVDYWAQIKQIVSTNLDGHVISARSLCEEAYPGQTTLWKTVVFQHIAIEHFAGSDAQSDATIISIGDSTDEFDASFETQKMLQTQYGVEPVHLIRFALQRSPSRDLMIEQFDVLSRVSGAMSGDAQQSSLDIQVADYL